MAIEHTVISPSRVMVLLLVAVTAVCFSCGSGNGGWSPPFNPAVCGMEEYQWLDPATMGSVVSYDPMTDYTMDMADVNALVKGSPYESVTPQYDVKMYRFAYETQDRGKRTQATAMLAFPDVTGDIPITASYILRLHGTCGWSDGCAASKESAETWTFTPIVLASQGLVVVAPDYIGMNGMPPPSTVKAPYFVGEATAIASLDSLRAVEGMLQRLQAKIALDNRVVIMGPSQGGHATFFTELYAPYYAARYDVIGAVAAIPLANIVEITEANIETFLDSGTKLVSVISTTLSRWYGYEGRLAEVLKTNGRSGPDFTTIVPEMVDQDCWLDRLNKYGIKTAADLYTTEFVEKVTDRSWQDMQPWYCMFAENSVDLSSVARVSTTPFLYIVASNDEINPTAVSQKKFDDLCNDGYVMEYLECQGAPHELGEFWSLLEQFNWVMDRLNGRPLTTTCIRSDPVRCRGSE